MNKYASIELILFELTNFAEASVKKLLFAITIILFLSFFLLTVFAQQPPSDSTLRNLDQKEYQFLKDQTQSFQKFIENERKEHREFIEGLYTIVVGVVGVIVTIGGGLFVFFDFRTRKNISQVINELFHEYGIQIIDEKNKSIKINIDELRHIIDLETGYKKKSILFLMSENDHQKFGIRELKIIDSRGIQNYQVYTQFDQAYDLIKKGTFDVVVYYYNPAAEDPKTNGDKQVRDILVLLVNRKSKTPLIIYNYEKGNFGRLYDVDMNEMSKYPYAVMANFPITLVNLLHTVTNYFPVN